MKLKSILKCAWVSIWESCRGAGRRAAKTLVVGFLATAVVMINGFAAAENKPIYPVILIPGVLGSKLCSASGEVLWGGSAKNSLSNFARLSLAGPKPESVKPCGILESIQVLGPLYSVAAYSGLLEAMKDWKLVDGSNLFIFDYDWRQSNLDTATTLERFVARKLGPDKKFNIVAHSMGGLVARLYLERAGAASRVNKVIYLGTPFLGSMSTLGTLSEGWGTIPNWIAGGVDGIRHTALSFPSLLELLPRYRECCSFKKSDGQYVPVNVFDARVWKADGWLPLDMRQGPAFARFSAQLKRASSLTPIFSSPPLSIAEVLFASDSRDTRFIFTARANSTSPSSKNWHFSMQPGDATVPVWSAARDTGLKSIAGSLVSFAEHSTIFDDDWVRNELKRELTSTEAILDRPIKGRGATTIEVDAAGQLRDWTLERMQISPSATYVSNNSPIDAVVALKFSSDARDVVAGLYKPSVLLRQNSTNVPMQVMDVTTDADANAGLLKFRCHGSSSAFKEGVVQLLVELPSAKPKTTGKEFLVILQ